MEEGLIFKLATIGVLGISAQWLAWRTRVPAIVLLLLAGIIAGPLLGLIHPHQDFGALLSPIVSVAVAIILFEGGLNLNFRELRGTSAAVRRLVFVAVPVSWGLGALAAHHLAGLSWGVAALFGGILVVTGPTVILPLLRQARLTSRPASLLKWEGIINDPLGALLAILVFEYLSVHGNQQTAASVGWLIAASVLAIGLGVALGRGVVALFARGLVPEHLKAAVLLVVVVAGYAAANRLQGETGLLTVTALGVTLANARFASLEEIRRFKENLTVILVSAVFVLLTASLQGEMLAQVADWGSIAFVLAIVLVVRPVSIWISTIGCGLSWQERTLLGWIAPRGVVAVAVSGFFASRLQQQGYADAAALVPLAFVIVFVTVVAHGFTVRSLAKRLGLAATGRPGVLIVGGSPWSAALARVLHEQEVAVLVIDSNWHHLRPARLAGVPVHFGEILSEATTFDIDQPRFGSLLAVTDNDAYNALVCTQLSPFFGREQVFQLGTREEEEHEMRGYAASARGRTLLHSGLGWSDLADRLAAGWKFQKTRLTEAYNWQLYLDDRPEGTETLLIIRPSGELLFETQKQRPTPKDGDLVISFAPPAIAPRNAAKQATLPG